jgi:hypothetical protein
MRLYVDLDTLVVSDFRNSGAAAGLSAKRSDRFSVEVRFVSQGVIKELPSGASGRITLKKTTEFSSYPVAWSPAWRKVGHGLGAYYVFRLNLHTQQVVDQFLSLQGELAAVTFAMEIQWEYRGMRRSSRAVTFVVENDYVRLEDRDEPPIAIFAGPPIVASGQSFVGKVGASFFERIVLGETMDRPVSTWSASGLPAGLSLNVAQGIVSGDPSAMGSFTAMISASGDGGAGVAQGVAFSILPGVPGITNTSFTGKVGAAFLAAPTVNDPVNRPVTAWSATGLPSWAGIDATSGVIASITPVGYPLLTPEHVATYDVTLRASGPGGEGAKVVTIIIGVGAPSIDAGQSFLGYVGQPFTVTPAIYDALDRPATSWSAVGLPAGLSINSATGQIAGTPEVAGSVDAELTATGPGGSNTRSVSISIMP